MDWITLLLLLVGIHYLCDYPLQTEFIAKGKGSFDHPMNGVPWYHLMTAHCAVHGLGVGLATGNWRLGVMEAMTHSMIDYSKCKKFIGINVDQGLHIVCKVAWVVLFFAQK